MKSKGAKIAFVLGWIVFGVVLYFLYGPNSDHEQRKKEKQKAYKTYLKTEATIVSQEGNGRVGKGAQTIWTLQFKDNRDSMIRITMPQQSFLGEDDGTKIIIYYDPNNQQQVVTEEDYNEVMK